MRARHWLWLVLLGGGALAGCGASTTADTPTTATVAAPAQPTVLGPDVSGNVLLNGAAGAVQPDAEVTVFNPNLYNESAKTTGKGQVTIAARDGSWAAVISAKSKDTLWVWQTVAGNRSPRIELRVP